MTERARGLPIAEPKPLAEVPSLPWPATWIEVQGRRLALYDTGARIRGVPVSRPVQDVPLLVVHGVQAGASAFEWEPFVMRQAMRRRVVALDLPGFGQSEKPDTAYSPAQMAAAVTAALDFIGASEVDVAALALGCEFAVETVLAQPHRVRSLALVSPTGMEARRIGEKYEDGRSREQGWLRSLLRAGTGTVGRGLFRALSGRSSIHLALVRSWGRRGYDPRLLEHALRCAQQPHSEHATLDFLSGALATVGIVERYRALPVPVWVAHGRHGAYTDFGSCPERTGTAAAGNTFRLQREVFDGGSMPHFELSDAFDAAYLRFLAALAPSAFRWYPRRANGGGASRDGRSSRPATLEL